MENFLSFKEIKDELIVSLRTANYRLTGRILTTEEENDWDLDNFMK